MKRTTIIGVILILIGIALGVWLLNKPKNNDNTNSSNTSESSSSSQSSTGEATATDQVMIQSFNFSPATITVKVGTKVTWTNMDSVSHTVTADTPSSDAPNSELFGQNETYSFTFNKAGTYAYHCTPHPQMRATVVVTE